MRGFLLAVFVLLVIVGELFSQAPATIQAPSSAGEQIQEAARASAGDRGASGVPMQHMGAIDILSDVQGVDLKSYLQPVLSSVRECWFKSIQEERATLRGKVVIQVEILKNGQVSNITLTESSGNVDLDRFAHDGVVAASPFQPLPSEFRGASLALRLRFYYNPTSADLPGFRTSKKTEPAMFPTTHAALIKPLDRRSLPKYPKKAIKHGIEGTVRLQVVVNANGTVESFSRVEGNETLENAAAKAIIKWRFRPAKENNIAVQERVTIEFEFHADHKIVLARIIRPDASAPIELTAAH